MSITICLHYIYKIHQKNAVNQLRLNVNSVKQLFNKIQVTISKLKFAPHSGYYRSNELYSYVRFC